MLMGSSEPNSFISTLGVPSEADPTTEQQDLLKVLIGAESVGTFRSAASGPLCVIRLPASDVPDRSFRESDWTGNWLRRPCHSVTILHDPTNVAYRSFVSPSLEGTHEASKHVTYLGLSDIIAISPHPTDHLQRVVDTFEARVYLLRPDRERDSEATMLAINRDGGVIDPEEDKSEPHWRPINGISTGALGSRAVDEDGSGATERSVDMPAEMDEARLLDFVAMNEIDARDEDLDLTSGDGARLRVPGRPPLF